jgi:hypothetical protein
MIADQSLKAMAHYDERRRLRRRRTRLSAVGRLLT